MNIQGNSVSPRQKSYGARIVGVSRTDFPLRQLAFALSAQLIIVGVTGDLARAEGPPSGKVFSACRVPPREAYGEVRKPTPENRKGYTFILAATRFKFEGAYDRVIEQVDLAINVDPTNPILYIERGAARTANHQLREAVEDLDRAIGLDPGSSAAFLERGALYTQMSEFGRAIEDIDESIKLFSGNARGYLQRGNVYLNTPSTTERSRISTGRSN
jgi:tetratricopeptide (TPR) repeat protein